LAIRLVADLGMHLSRDDNGFASSMCAKRILLEKRGPRAPSESFQRSAAPARPAERPKSLNPGVALTQANADLTSEPRSQVRRNRGPHLDKPVAVVIPSSIALVFLVVEIGLVAPNTGGARFPIWRLFGLVPNLKRDAGRRCHPRLTGSSQLFRFNDFAAQFNQISV
jgi:hypothetical protein